MTVSSPYTFGARVRRLAVRGAPIRRGGPPRQGFGVLTEIDVAATMKARLGSSATPPHPRRLQPSPRPPALGIDPSVGALLPCNVVLRADRDGTIVEAMDPGPP